MHPERRKAIIGVFEKLDTTGLRKMVEMAGGIEQAIDIMFGAADHAADTDERKEMAEIFKEGLTKMFDRVGRQVDGENIINKIPGL